MKKLVIALFILPFVFSCNGGSGLDSPSSRLKGGSDLYKKGIVRVEIEHGDFIGDLQQEVLSVMLSRWNESMKNIKIIGSEHVFEKPSEIVQYINNDKFYTYSILAKPVNLRKKLIYETSEKVQNLRLSYVINYKRDDDNHPNQDLPIKVKLYVDGKLKGEKSAVCKIRTDLIKTSSYSIVSVDYGGIFDSFSFSPDSYPKEME